MQFQIRSQARVIALVSTFAVSALPSALKAQTYPIDCAILLCLSGGWPASVPCAHARAEFIRRITPWPIEPPLQIWRCPMGVTYEEPKSSDPRGRVYQIRSQSTAPISQQSYPAFETGRFAQTLPISESSSGFAVSPLPVQDRADVDISGPEFNFVRSIRVFDVRRARQRESDQDQDCNRSATVFLGSYGTQGDFSWRRSSIDALPSTHVGLEEWGHYCPSISHRSVFVEWRDYRGNYGSEQVNY